MLIDGYKNTLLEILLNNGSIPAEWPENFEIALHTAEPDLEGDLNEVAGGNYVRQPVAFESVGNGRLANSEQVIFEGLPEATITHVSIADSDTGDIFWYKGFMYEGVAEVGDMFIINQSALIVSLD